jgi:hypothetical protein
MENVENLNVVPQNCVISKTTRKKLELTDTIVEEISLTVSGNELKEVEQVFKRQWEGKK